MVREKEIRERIQLLFPALGGVRRQVDLSLLKDIYEKQNLRGLLRFIADDLGLNLKLMLALVNRGGPKDAVAWIVSEGDETPPYGSSKFKNSCAVVYFKKEFIKQASFEEIIFTSAHELSHIVLYSIHHPFANEEGAVDLTAAILGYRILTNKINYRMTMHGIRWFNFLNLFAPNKSLGYLHGEEIIFANKIINDIYENQNRS